MAAAPGRADRELELERLRALVRRLEAHARPARSTPRPAAFALEAVPTPHGPALRHVETVPAPAAPWERPPAPGTVYLDTETTGLAGGTGTYVFLVGLATWADGALRVTQYFLGDLGAEAAFLHAVRDAVADARELVTYNGRTFDFPLLETRYLLGRASWWGTDLAHRDLYPLARALWRSRVGDCRLTTLEAALLGLDRGDDLPGALVPHLYFRYLRTRDATPLPRIFGHNRWDLVALAGLDVRAEALLGGPGPRQHPVEWVGAGRWLERRDPARGARFYEAALQAGLPDPLAARVAWRLGLLWRRAGRIDAARALWTATVARDPRPPLGLLLDLAKLHEHCARDFTAALDVTRAALARVEAEAWSGGAEVVEALRRRASRLTRRLRGAAGPPPAGVGAPLA
jgi:hypothetical protein